MEQGIITDKPEDFSEYFCKRLAECIARGIVEQSIRSIHDREQIEDDNQNPDITPGTNRFIGT